MNKSKRINGSKSSCIAVLDVGSTKVACFIAQIIDNKEAIANPESLEFYANLPQLKF